MSCHSIGHGINVVAGVVEELFSQGKISKDDARQLFLACRQGVRWCDGNEYEAVECINDCRCGLCMEKKEKLLPVTDHFVHLKYDRLMDTFPLVTENVCPECMEILIQAMDVSQK